MIAVFWNRDHARIRSGWRLVLQMVCGLLLTIVIFRLLGGWQTQLEADFLKAELALTAGIVLSVAVAGRWLDRRRFADFGMLLGLRWWCDLLFGLVLGTVLMSGVWVIAWAAGWVTVSYSSLAGSAPPWTAFARMTVVFVLVGFNEELLSRGYQLRNLAEGCSGRILGRQGAVWAALLLSSVIFAALHMGNLNVTPLACVNLVLAGMLLGLPVLLTARLGLSVGLHITWNLTQGMVFGFAVSGERFDTTILQTEVDGPAWWTGGAFGPEAGLLGTGAIAVGALLILLWLKLLDGRLVLHSELAEVPAVKAAGSFTSQPLR